MRNFLALATVLLLPLAAPAENLQQLNQLLNNRQCLKCDLNRAGLVQTDLARVQLAGSDLSDASLGRSNLRGANLQNVNLSRASLVGADLAGANLQGANLTQTDLGGANLQGANLKGAKFAQTDLRHAVLSNANFEDVDFRNAYLQGAIDVPLFALKAEEFYIWGMDDGKRGNHRGAIENFNRSIEVDPKFAPAYIGRAAAKKELRDIDGAIKDAQKAELVYQSQNNAEGALVASNLAKFIQNPPEQAQNKNNPLSGIFTSLGSLILPFFLR